MNRSLFRLIAVLLALAFGIASCSSDDSADEGGDTTVPSSEDENDTPVDSSDTDGTEGSIDPSNLSDECKAALEGFTNVQSQFSTAATGQSFDFDEAKDELQALADTAPDEVSGAFQVWADELGAYFDELQKLGLDDPESLTPEKLVELGTLSSKIDNDAVEEATNEIDAYFEETCNT